MLFLGIDQYTRQLTISLLNNMTEVILAAKVRSAHAAVRSGGREILAVVESPRSHLI